jgi:ATP-dependent exoDNAse (exonuclease V) beta subunit
MMNLNVFNGILFDEPSHTYTLDDHTFSKSVTKLVEEYAQPFDEDYWAEYKAKKEGVSVQEIKDRWEKVRVASQIRGTNFHNYMECKLKGIGSDYSDNKELKELGDIFCAEMIESGKLTSLGIEQVVFDVDLDVAGTVDFVGVNHLGEYIILDWKTNKEIKCQNSYQSMKVPFESYDDCNFYHYSLQLNIYRHIIEKHCNVKIPHLYFVWFNESIRKAKLFKCEEMDVKAILE